MNGNSAGGQGVSEQLNMEPPSLVTAASLYNVLESSVLATSGLGLTGGTPAIPPSLALFLLRPKSMSLQSLLYLLITPLISSLSTRVPSHTDIMIANLRDAALPVPVLTVLPPSSEELKSNKATLVCLASDMSVGFADVRWLVNGNSVTSGVITGSVQQQDNKKFTLSSYLTIDSSEWDNSKVITCEVSAGGKAASVKINKSECSE
ncbi:hypothetical protein KOW79_021695 [Hemibagrus wyckioides]|uniref:Ig-like domain-containing protein n=1 Tax=Hemibagrus wyckioides TaxID=337641 RepID=A0A9D3S8C1_9TELE|nr:hypothetical protein KOW79_021695 [Hemibagrus wyckioides]